MVLIETYWNVNESLFIDGVEYPIVLIETYWNVNLDDKLNQAVIDFSLNRNILECKSRIARRVCVDSIGLNRNILECKFI